MHLRAATLPFASRTRPVGGWEARALSTLAATSPVARTDQQIGIIGKHLNISRVRLFRTLVFLYLEFQNTFRTFTFRTRPVGGWEGRALSTLAATSPVARTDQHIGEYSESNAK